MIVASSTYASLPDSDLIAQALHAWHLGPEQRAMLAQALAARLYARIAKPQRAARSVPDSVVEPTTPANVLPQTAGDKWE